MTLEQFVATYSEVKEISEDVKKYNEAFQNAKFDESHKIAEKIENSVKEFAEKMRKECHNALLETADPMLEAVKQLRFETVRTKLIKEEGSTIPTMVLEVVERDIGLLKLHKAAADGIGQNKSWYYMIEKLNCLLTAKTAQDLGINPTSVNDSFAMSKIAKSIDIGETPTSNTKLLAALQTIITAMVGEQYKVKSHDVEFLKKVYTKKSRKALTVTCANNKALTNYIAEICHRIVLEKSYSVEYKEVKKA